jgi:subtilisin family serine protease
MSVVALLATGAVPAGAKVRHTKAIGERAARLGLLSPPPKGHDFTRIRPGALYKPGELLVRFAPKVNGKAPGSAEKGRILSSVGGGMVRREYGLVPGLTLVKLPPGLTVEKALKRFNRDKRILYAEPNYGGKVTATNDTHFSRLWGMHNTGQTGGTPDADIDAPEAWNIGTGNSNVVVAVLDSGVDYYHEDLATNMWINPGEDKPPLGVITEDDWDGSDDDENGYTDDICGYDFCSWGKPRDSKPLDGLSHGTHCAGTVGAVGNNSQGVVGVCWDVSIMAVKWISDNDRGYVDDVIDSINYAVTMGADVLSNSWQSPWGYDAALGQTIESAGSAGVLFVVAAGNGSREITQSYPHYPPSYDTDNMITVLSTTHHDIKSSFSNYSDTYVDLGAPGSSIYSCTPGDYYGYKSGTSMACPHVAGACALLLSLDSSLDYTKIKNILMDDVDPLALLSGKCVSEGRLNLHNAVLDERIGVGWLEVDPEEGTVGPGSSTNLNVTFDAEFLDTGVYGVDLVISFDGGPTFTIPVQLTVEP